MCDSALNVLHFLLYITFSVIFVAQEDSECLNANVLVVLKPPYVWTFYDKKIYTIVLVNKIKRFIQHIVYC